MYASADAGAAAALRWTDLRAVFLDFEPSRLALLSTGEMEVLAHDPRAGGEVELAEAVVANAEAIMAIVRENGSFDAYVRRHASADELVAALMQDFHGLDRAGAELFVRLLEGDEWQADLGLERSA